MIGQSKTHISSTEALAESLGLSRWAVSRALNGRPGVSEETARRVREAAIRSGFSPSALGRGLRAGSTNLVGVCVPDLEQYFLAGKVVALQAAIVGRGLESILQITDGSREAEERAVRHFRAMRCQSAVLFATRLAGGIPGLACVFVDPLEPGRDVPSVSADRAAAMRLAIAHLAGLGHDSACIAGVSPAGSYYSERMRGLRQGLRKAGWNPSSLLFLNAPSKVDDFDRGEVLAHEWIQLGRKRPRAIIALNDRIGFAILAILRRHNVLAPRDVSVIGYDGTRLSRLSDPPLTSIDPGHDAIIASVSSALANPLAKCIRIKPRLMLGGSTGPPPD